VVFPHPIILEPSFNLKLKFDSEHACVIRSKRLCTVCDIHDPNSLSLEGQVYDSKDKKINETISFRAPKNKKDSALLIFALSVPCSSRDKIKQMHSNHKIFDEDDSKQVDWYWEKQPNSYCKEFRTYNSVSNSCRYEDLYPGVQVKKKEDSK